MPPTTATLSLGSAGLDLPSARTLATERQLTLHDLPRRAMAIVGASLSKKDIRALRLVSRGVCSLVTACIKGITVPLKTHDRADTVERALVRYTGVPQLTVEVSWGASHLLRAEGLPPRMQHLYLRGSSDGELDEVARILQGATRLRTAVISFVKTNKGLRLAANCLGLEKLYLFSEEKSTSPVDFRQVSGLSNLQHLSCWGSGTAWDLSPLKSLTGLTHLVIKVGQEVSLRPLAHLPKLNSLRITCRRGDLREDFVLGCLAGECRGKLQLLKLVDFGSVTAEAVRHLSLCTSLVYLRIYADKLPRLADMEPMLKGLPHLEMCWWNHEKLQRS